MNYAILLIGDEISMPIQILGNKEFSITIKSNISLNKNDKVLGFLTKNQYPDKVKFA